MARFFLFTHLVVIMELVEPILYQRQQLISLGAISEEGDFDFSSILFELLGITEGKDLEKASILKLEGGVFEDHPRPESSSCKGDSEIRPHPLETIRISYGIVDVANSGQRSVPALWPDMRVMEDKSEHLEGETPYPLFQGGSMRLEGKVEDGPKLHREDVEGKGMKKIKHVGYVAFCPTTILPLIECEPKFSQAENEPHDIPFCGEEKSLAKEALLYERGTKEATWPSKVVAGLKDEVGLSESASKMEHFQRTIKDLLDEYRVSHKSPASNLTPLKAKGKGQNGSESQGALEVKKVEDLNAKFEAKVEVKSENFSRDVLAVKSDVEVQNEGSPLRVFRSPQEEDITMPDFKEGESREQAVKDEGIRILKEDKDFYHNLKVLSESTFRGPEGVEAKNNENMGFVSKLSRGLYGSSKGDQLHLRMEFQSGESLRVALRQDGEKVFVSLRTTSEILANFLETQRFEIAKSLEEKNILAFIQVQADSDSKGKNRERQRRERTEAKPRESFERLSSVFMEV